VEAVGDPKAHTGATGAFPVVVVEQDLILSGQGGGGGNFPFQYTYTGTN